MPHVLANNPLPVRIVATHRRFLTGNWPATRLSVTCVMVVPGAGFEPARPQRVRGV